MKDCVSSAHWKIHESSQNPVTMYGNLDFRGFSKIVFPSALWCFHAFSQTPATIQKISKIGCFNGITAQLSKKVQQMNTFSLNTLKLYDSVFVLKHQNLKPHFHFLVHTHRRNIEGSLQDILTPNFKSCERSKASFIQIYKIS